MNLRDLTERTGLPVYVTDPEYREDKFRINQDCPAALEKREVNELTVDADEYTLGPCLVVHLAHLPAGECELGYRVCSVCNTAFDEGFYDGERTGNYYCSDDCLHRDYTDEEWLALYYSDGDSYWTTWY